MTKQAKVILVALAGLLALLVIFGPIVLALAFTAWMVLIVLMWVLNGLIDLLR